MLFIMKSPKLQVKYAFCYGGDYTVFFPLLISLSLCQIFHLRARKQKSVMKDKARENFNNLQLAYTIFFFVHNLIYGI